MAKPATKALKITRPKGDGRVVNFYDHPKFAVNGTQEIIDTSDYRGTVAYIQKLLFNDKKNSYTQIAKECQIGISTVYRLRDGESRSPHRRTTDAVLKFYGFKQMAVR